VRPSGMQRALTAAGHPASSIWLSVVP